MQWSLMDAPELPHTMEPGSQKDDTAEQAERPQSADIDRCRGGLQGRASP